MGLLHKSQYPVCITPRCKKYFFLRTLPCMINKIIQLNKNDFDSLIILCFGPFITSKTSLLIFFSVAHKHTQSHTHTHTFDRPENIDFSHTHALTWTRTFFYQKLRGCLLCCSVIDRMPRISVTEWEGRPYPMHCHVSRKSGHARRSWYFSPSGSDRSRIGVQVVVR